MLSKTVFYKIVLLLSVVFFIGCKNEGVNSSSEQKPYTLYILDKEGNEFLVAVSSLDQDSVVPEKEGVQLNLDEMQRDLIVKNGFYYRKNGDQFLKYQLSGKELKRLGAITLPDFYLCNFVWVDADTLLLLGSSKSSSTIKSAKVNVKNMTVSETNMEIQAPFDPYTFLSIGISKLKNNQLIVGYTYHFQGSDRYQTSDTSYIAVLTYPGMKSIKVFKDTRSTFPGGENTIEPSSFTNDSGDFYFMACPGVAMGNYPSKPTGIYRIKKNETGFDSAYFFNISTSIIRNHAYSIYDIGHGKALVRSERKDLFTSWNEHWKVPHFEFYVLDLASQTASRLPLPLDKGTRRQCVIVEKDRAYISINSDKEGNYIWSYNSLNGALTKGLKVGGASDFILRIDKIHTTENTKHTTTE